jgi:hypothetical protein
VNAAAPQAPVAAVGKNKKTHHDGTPAALGRGLAKGSPAFQQLLNARAARLAALAAGVKAHAAEGGAAQADGLKRTLVDLLKSQLAARHPVTPEDVTAGTAAAKAHEDASRKSAHAKAAGQATALVALGRPDAQPGAQSAAKEPKTEPTDPSKAPAAEARTAAHRAEPITRIVDLRRPQKQAATAEASKDGKSEPALVSDRDPSGGIARAAAPRSGFADALSRTPSASASQPQTPLEHLRDMAGSELVRASTMVLRDGGGEIRLVLKPESLGSVRVRMNLVDNHIEGRIIVDSAAVKHVFDGSVDALRRALTAEGFQMGSLQVSVGGQDAQADQGRRDRQPPEAVRRVAAQGFERSVPGAEDVSLGDLFVNLFV